MASQKYIDEFERLKKDTLFKEIAEENNLNPKYRDFDIKFIVVKETYIQELRARVLEYRGRRKEKIKNGQNGVKSIEANLKKSVNRLHSLLDGEENELSDSNEEKEAIAKLKDLFKERDDAIKAGNNKKATELNSKLDKAIDELADLLKDKKDKANKAEEKSKSAPKEDKKDKTEENASKDNKKDKANKVEEKSKSTSKDDKKDKTKNKPEKIKSQTENEKKLGYMQALLSEKQQELNETKDITNVAELRKEIDRINESINKIQEEIEKEKNSNVKTEEKKKLKKEEKEETLEDLKQKYEEKKKAYNNAKSDEEAEKIEKEIYEIEAKMRVFTAKDNLLKLKQQYEEKKKAYNNAKSDEEAEKIEKEIHEIEAKIKAEKDIINGKSKTNVEKNKETEKSKPKETTESNNPKFVWNENEWMTQEEMMKAKYPKANFDINYDDIGKTYKDTYGDKEDDGKKISLDTEPVVNGEKDPKTWENIDQKFNGDIEKNDESAKTSEAKVIFNAKEGKYQLFIGGKVRDAISPLDYNSNERKEFREYVNGKWGMDKNLGKLVDYNVYELLKRYDDKYKGDLATYYVLAIREQEKHISKTNIVYDFEGFKDSKKIGFFDKLKISKFADIAKKRNVAEVNPDSKKLSRGQKIALVFLAAIGLGGASGYIAAINNQKALPEASNDPTISDTIDRTNIRKEDDRAISEAVKEVEKKTGTIPNVIVDENKEVIDNSGITKEPKVEDISSDIENGDFIDLSGNIENEEFEDISENIDEKQNEGMKLGDSVTVNTDRLYYNSEGATPTCNLDSFMKNNPNADFIISRIAVKSGDKLLLNTTEKGLSIDELKQKFGDEVQYYANFKVETPSGTYIDIGWTSLDNVEQKEEEQKENPWVVKDSDTKGKSGASKETEEAVKQTLDEHGIKAHFDDTIEGR